MVINFNQKTRKILSIIVALIILVGGGIYTFKPKNSLETSKLEAVKNIDRYTIEAIFDDESKRLMCNQNVEYVNNTDKDLDKVYFHIYPNAFSKKEFAPFEKEEMKKAYPNGFNEGYIDIKNILNNGNKLSYEIKGDKNDLLEIKLGKNIKPNEKISIDMKYNVKLPNSLGRFGYGDNTINVTNWFPIACVNDDRGWSLKSYESLGDPFYSDTSDFYVKLLAPRKYKIGSTGKVTNEKFDSNRGFYEIEAKKVRDFAFILSEKFNIDKDSFKGITINTYNLNEKLSKASTKIAKDSIEIFSDLFGDYPYDTYSVIASDFFIGGMEYPMLVMIDQSLYNEKNQFLLEYVIAHETAHQWWYSVIGNDEINEPWLDEALTEYSTVLYFEKKYGKDVGDKLIKTMEIQTKHHLSENIFKPSTQYKNSTDYSLNVYTKGAVVFNEIRNKVGDEVFFNTLKEYYTKYKYQNVNGAKFVELWNDKGVDIDKIIREYK
ncbi:M1 family peptidase [Romboutsia maritimum]|uniref:M1 family peptidase n=1 Tax=Romboutsia maritimum TaxID=2020948 RepID=A0A371ISJ2_9FIRM|nr:M1 family metallopeptidase [Romboutsia maritimum]RDY23457.1 M1 family peptidase [Romboutsia maritimum]